MSRESCVRCRDSYSPRRSRPRLHVDRSVSRDRLVHSQPRNRSRGDNHRQRSPSSDSSDRPRDGVDQVCDDTNSDDINCHQYNSERDRKEDTDDNDHNHDIIDDESENGEGYGHPSSEEHDSLDRFQNNDRQDESEESEDEYSEDSSEGSSERDGSDSNTYEED